MPVIAGNNERFFGNKGKDVEQRKFFIVNNKQYTVYNCTFFA